MGYIEGPRYDSVRLGCDSTAVEFNSVLLIPGLLSEEECAALVADVERHRLDCALYDDGAEHDAVGGDMPGSVAAESFGGDYVAAGGYNGDGGYERHMVPSLSPSTSALFQQVLRKRLLPFLASELPEVEDMIWARSTRAANKPWCALM